jgi:carbon-monoxide dehydrogenase large subunit
MPESALRVVAVDVGGAFGVKSQIYPEEALVLWAAAKLRRPVKWTGERTETIASDTHGRAQIAQASMAFDSQGRILAFRTAVEVDLGAYLGYSAGVPPLNAVVPSSTRSPAASSPIRRQLARTAARANPKPPSSWNGSSIRRRGK